MTTLAERIEQCLGGRAVLVVGVGNRLHGDDAAGSRVAEQLAAGGRECVFDAELSPENYLGVLLDASPEVVLFVDAAELGETPGACRLAAIAELAPRVESTHMPSLRLAADLLAAYGVESMLLGIQPGCTSADTPLSPAVAAGVDEAARAIARLLDREVCHG